MPQQLSSKENSLFRQLVKNYETKQHKKGIKVADQILKKTPNHGDTQAMKALILNTQGQTDEAFALAKVALKNDVKSHICWHVYGILYRSARNYDEAIKAYKFALRLEPGSLQIQRDLAVLQIQVRDYQGYIETRRAMLRSRPQLRSNWTALAVAFHLAGQPSDAIDILDRYERTLRSPPPRSDIEHSEAALYKNTIIADTGDLDAGLRHLNSIYKSNADRTAVMELRADYLLRLGRRPEAEKAYRELLDRNPEYRAYYDCLEVSLELDRSRVDHADRLLELYQSFANDDPRCDAPYRIPLDFLQDGKFRTVADNYLRRMLTKGVPSTFNNVKALYRDLSKKKIIEDLLLGYESEERGEANGDSADRFTPAILYFLAQHYNYHLSRDLAKALHYVDRAIERDPDFVDYTMTKARIWKNYGDVEKAAAIMNVARELDEKDRYINTKCAKYQLRNNENDKAIATMSKFTRNEAVGGALGDLHDMQCMWYLLEDGEAFVRKGELGLALKRFQAIYDIFDVWEEDQFDFHSFSLRRGQIRTYVDMIRWQDNLRAHPFYTRAAIVATKIYTLLHDRPDLAHPQTNGTAVPKKAKKGKKEQENKPAAKAAPKPALDGDGLPRREDADPQGVKLRETSTPLDDAMKYVSHLLQSSPSSIEAQNASFEVFIRRRKWLLALKCLLSAHSIDPENPTLHHQTVRFKHTLNSLSEDERLEAPVKTVIGRGFTLIPPDTPTAAFNAAYLKRHADSAAHMLAGLKARFALDPAKSGMANEIEALRLLSNADVAFTLEDARAMRDALRTWGSEEHVLKRFEEGVRQRWPNAVL